MLKEIVLHEIRKLWRDRGGPIVAVLIFAAALFGSWNGHLSAADQQSAQHAILSEENDGFAGLQAEARAIETGEKEEPLYGSPLKAASLSLFYPRTAVLPPNPFAFLSVGQSDVYPSFYKVSGRQREAFIDSTEIENPMNLLTGRFDLSFAIIYLLPLFVLGLSYDLLAGERESGTLRLLFAQGARLRQLIFGKIAARMLFLLVPLFLAAGLAAALFGAGGAALWAKLAIFCLVSFSYAGFWFVLATAVNLRGAGAATNALLLASLWIALVILVPAFIHLGAKSVFSVPSRLELIAASRDAQVRARRPVELLEAYYAKYPDHRPIGKDLNVYDFPFYYNAIQREIDREIAPIVEDIEKEKGRQQQFVKGASFLSPSMAVQEIFNDLAGTGHSRNSEFYRQLMDFYQSHLDFFEERSYSDISLTASDYDRMPRFRFIEEPFGELTARIGRQFLLFLILPAGLGLYMWAGFRRLKLD